jgi:hypothetical protein
MSLFGKSSPKKQTAEELASQALVTTKSNEPITILSEEDKAKILEQEEKQKIQDETEAKDKKDKEERQKKQDDKDRIEKELIEVKLKTMYDLCETVQTN